MNEDITLFWLRRDLRLEDNKGLYHALKGDNRVMVFFVFDTDILGELPEDDHRVTFIHQQLTKINEELKEHNSSLYVCNGKPIEEIQKLFQTYSVTQLVTNKDYEPYATKRDMEIATMCKEHDVVFDAYNDHLIFEPGEVLKDDGDPYLVYTPYKNRWHALFSVNEHTKEFDSYALLDTTYQDTELPFLSLEDIGFTPSKISAPSYILNDNLIDSYEESREYPPDEKGTSHLGTYLRFGCVSVRRVAQQAATSENHTFLNELVWREFYATILFYFPHSQHQEFKEKYAGIAWRNNEEEFEKWKEGKTGFPLVDAGMRELNTTGYMHNRVRMVVASFLCKDLLIDWRWGERYFAEKLFDYELASNVGNWQWAAGTGVDAAPYFRIFNPESQFEKYDPEGTYVKKWIPEFSGIGYVSPMVDHKEARERCLEVYKAALDRAKSD
jgi:deoxyribodipyrimidine photo-lyase